MSVRSPLVRPLALAAIVVSFTWLALLAVQPRWLYVYSPNNFFSPRDWSQLGMLWAPHATSALAVLAVTALSVATRTRWLAWLGVISGVAHGVLCAHTAWLYIASHLSLDMHRPLMAIACILLTLAPAFLVGVFAIATPALSAMPPHTAAMRRYAVPLLAIACAGAAVVSAAGATVMENARMGWPLLTVTTEFLNLMQGPVFAAAMLGIAMLGVDRSPMPSLPFRTVQRNGSVA